MTLAEELTKKLFKMPPMYAESLLVNEVLERAARECEMAQGRAELGSPAYNELGAAASRIRAMKTK